MRAHFDLHSERPWGYDPGSGTAHLPVDLYRGSILGGFPHDLVMVLRPPKPTHGAYGNPLEDDDEIVWIQTGCGKYGGLWFIPELGAGKPINNPTDTEYGGEPMIQAPTRDLGDVYREGDGSKS